MRGAAPCRAARGLGRAASSQLRVGAARAARAALASHSQSDCLRVDTSIQLTEKGCLFIGTLGLARRETHRGAPRAARAARGAALASHSQSDCLRVDTSIQLTEKGCLFIGTLGLARRETHRGAPRAARAARAAPHLNWDYVEPREPRAAPDRAAAAVRSHASVYLPVDGSTASWPPGPAIRGMSVFATARCDFENPL